MCLLLLLISAFVNSATVFAAGHERSDEVLFDNRSSELSRRCSEILKARSISLWEDLYLKMVRQIIRRTGFPVREEDSSELVADMRYFPPKIRIPEGEPVLKVLTLHHEAHHAIKWWNVVSKPYSLENAALAVFVGIEDGEFKLPGSMTKQISTNEPQALYLTGKFAEQLEYANLRPSEILPPREYFKAVKSSAKVIAYIIRQLQRAVDSGADLEINFYFLDYAPHLRLAKLVFEGARGEQLHFVVLLEQHLRRDHSAAKLVVSEMGQIWLNHAERRSWLK